MNYPYHDDMLSLIPFTESDAQTAFALILANRAHLDPWMRWVGRIQSEDDMRAYFQSYGERYAAKTGVHLGIWQQDVLCGGFAIHAIDRNSNHCEIGYWLGSAFVGRGLVTHAAQVVIADLFEAEGMHRLEIRAAADNVPSRKVAERLGFTYEGIARESEWLTDRYADHAVYSLLRHEWQPTTPR